MLHGRLGGWPGLTIAVVLLVGGLLSYGIRASRAKSKGIDEARPECVEALGPEQCEQHIELYADECFRANYTPPSGRRYGNRKPGYLEIKPFTDCLVMTPPAWDAQDRAARQKMREETQKRDEEMRKDLGL